MTLWIPAHGRQEPPHRAVGRVLAHHGRVGSARSVHAGQQGAIQQADLVVDALDLGLALIRLLGVVKGEQVA